MNYDGNYISCHCLSRMYKISGRLIFVEQNVHNFEHIPYLGNDVVWDRYTCNVLNNYVKFCDSGPESSVGMVHGL